VTSPRIGYDRVVLATGSMPTLPPIRGLVTPEGRRHPKVHAFRSLADCRGLDAAVPRARRAVVVGGGLLGLQVARALGVRGLEVDLVEGTSHLLSSQIGEQAGAVLARSMRHLGAEVYTHTRGVRMTDEGLRLDTGYTIPADLVVLTAGGRPATALAKRAGLFVRRGVVVDAQLRSVTDEHVHAIGDCAEHGGRTTGFVPPAWEQAGVLAAVLAGEESGYDGSRIVARLRATGVDVAVMGDPEHTDGDVVEIANPVTGTYRKLVVRAGVLEAAVMVGDLSRVGLLTQLFDRRTVLAPEEPGQLLMTDAPVFAAPLPDDAEVCACAGVSAGRVRACPDMPTVVTETRATTGCGGCTQAVKELVDARPIGL
jgi:assimilatory nitrate reductase electron transfer subunit